MRYKPERALTLRLRIHLWKKPCKVEMRYKPERALTQDDSCFFDIGSKSVEMRYKPVSKALVLVTIK